MANSAGGHINHNASFKPYNGISMCELLAHDCTRCFSRHRLTVNPVISLLLFFRCFLCFNALGHYDLFVVLSSGAAVCFICFYVHLSFCCLIA